MALPECFCWTRFGTEAGESIESIFARKERERVANGGMFLWGIGNAVGPSVRELLRLVGSPEVLFSPIKSAARQTDVAPRMVVAWTSGVGLDGSLFCVPENSLVTSRHDPGSTREDHFALVCAASEPLTRFRSSDRINFTALRNLRTGRPVGASQVTAVVRTDRSTLTERPGYEVVIRADLAYPYLVRLRRPVALPNREHIAIRGDAWVQDALRLIQDRNAELVPQQLTLSAYSRG
jgi:hypothetical protein